MCTSSDFIIRTGVVLMVPFVFRTLRYWVGTVRVNCVLYLC